MKYYGVRGIVYELMKSYLSEWLQCVKMRQTVSDFKKFTCEDSQGSVLGLLLFLIYINDIHKSDLIAEFYLFADDTALFCANKNINQIKNNINTSLDNAVNWLKVKNIWTNQNSSILTCHQCVKEMYLIYMLMVKHWTLTTKQNILG